MLRRMWIVAAFALCCVGCGTYTVIGERYDREGTPYKDGDTIASLGILATETSKQTGLLSSKRSYLPPYRLSFYVRTTRDEGEPVKLHGVTLEHQGKTIVVRRAGDAALQATLSPQKQHGDAAPKFDARIMVPLESALPFIDGSALLVQAEVKLPEDEGRRTLKQSFRGKRTAGSASIWQQ